MVLKMWLLDVGRTEKEFMFLLISNVLCAFNVNKIFSNSVDYKI